MGWDHMGGWLLWGTPHLKGEDEVFHVVPHSTVNGHSEFTFSGWLSIVFAFVLRWFLVSN